MHISYIQFMPYYYTIDRKFGKKESKTNLYIEKLLLLVKDEKSNSPNYVRGQFNIREFFYKTDV